MLDIIPLLLCLQSEISMTTIRQFSRIALALLAMTGRVTMLGISRWASGGASSRCCVKHFVVRQNPLHIIDPCNHPIL